MQIHDTANPQPTRRSTRQRFLSRAIPVALVASFGALAALAATRSVTAAGDDGPRACSVRTLRGDYGILVSGRRPTSHAGAVESFVGTAIRRYDGRGGFTQVDSSFGEITGDVKDVPAFGTYEVQADCSGTSAISFPGNPFPVPTHFVIVNHGDEVKDTAPGPTIATLWRVGG
ncbi:MAG: hypothetical protein ABJA98_02905 [Acidobacteriota bacterium]